MVTINHESRTEIEAGAPERRLIRIDHYYLFQTIAEDGFDRRRKIFHGEQRAACAEIADGQRHGRARRKGPEKKTLLWDQAPPGVAGRPPRNKPLGAAPYQTGRKQA